MLAPWPATVAMLAGNLPAAPRRWPATRTRRVLLWDDVGEPRAALLSRAATPAETPKPLQSTGISRQTGMGG